MQVGEGRSKLLAETNEVNITSGLLYFKRYGFSARLTKLAASFVPSGANGLQEFLPQFSRAAICESLGLKALHFFATLSSGLANEGPGDAQLVVSRLGQGPDKLDAAATPCQSARSKFSYPLSRKYRTNLSGC